MSRFSGFPEVALNLFQNSERIANQIADLFLKLIKISPRTRHLVLSWVGEVLHVNKGKRRNKLKLPSIFISASVKLMTV